MCVCVWIPGVREGLKAAVEVISSCMVGGRQHIHGTDSRALLHKITMLRKLIFHS